MAALPEARLQSHGKVPVGGHLAPACPTRPAGCAESGGAMIIGELRQHRLRQAEQLLALGVRLDDDHHVVVREDGEPLQPRSLTHAFTKFVRQARGLQRIRLHDLRHSHATHMLQRGRASKDRASSAWSFQRERDHRLALLLGTYSQECRPKPSVPLTPRCRTR